MPDQPNTPATGSSPTDLTLLPDGDYAATFNARRDGWNSAMGIRLLRANADEVTAELEIEERHRQAYGIVHGGVYCGLVETVSSVGAELWARRHQQCCRRRKYLFFARDF